MKTHRRLLLNVSLVAILALSLVFGTVAFAAGAVGHPDSWFASNTARTAGADGANGAGHRVAFLQKILKKVGITEEYFQQLRDSGLNIKDILTASAIAKAAKAPVADIIAAKQAGKTWPQIAADNKVDLKDLKTRALGWMHGFRGHKGDKNGKPATPADRIAAMQKRIDRETKQLANLDTRITDLEKQAAAQTDAQKKQNLEEKAQIARLQKNVVQTQLDRDNYILKIMQAHQNTNTSASTNIDGTPKPPLKETSNTRKAL